MLARVERVEPRGRRRLVVLARPGRDAVGVVVGRMKYTAPPAFAPLTAKWDADGRVIREEPEGEAEGRRHLAGVIGNIYRASGRASGPRSLTISFKTSSL